MYKRISKETIFSENRIRADSVSENGTWITILIPDMNFTCSGIIEAVTVVATGKDRGMAISGQDNQTNGNQNPKLQIWRQIKWKNGMFYRKNATFNLMTCTENDSDEVRMSRNASIFICMPQAADKILVSVQDGDILGIELPPTNTDSDFEFYFTKHGTQNYIFSQNISKINLTKNNYSGVSQQPQIQFSIKPGITKHS